MKAQKKSAGDETDKDEATGEGEEVREAKERDWLLGIHHTRWRVGEKGTGEERHGQEIMDGSCGRARECSMGAADCAAVSCVFCTTTTSMCLTGFWALFMLARRL